MAQLINARIITYINLQVSAFSIRDQRKLKHLGSLSLYLLLANKL